MRRFRRCALRCHRHGRILHRVIRGTASRSHESAKQRRVSRFHVDLPFGRVEPVPPHRATCEPAPAAMGSQGNRALLIRRGLSEERPNASDVTRCLNAARTPARLGREDSSIVAPSGPESYAVSFAESPRPSRGHAALTFVLDGNCVTRDARRNTVDLFAPVAVAWSPSVGATLAARATGRICAIQTSRPSVTRSAR